MKYTVKTYNDWTRPYFYSGEDNRLIRAKTTEEQETGDIDLAVSMVKDWLDAPDRDMTDADVRREFDSDTRKIADEYVEQIKNYYNGRFGIFEKFKKDFENAKSGDTLKYDIPYELNHFETEPCDDIPLGTQNESYFEVTLLQD